ncbi:MAG: response regulator transcription factor [Bacteroidota bacterium]
MRTKVIIADDHPIFRQGLRALIQGNDGFELIGEAGDGHEALKLIEEQHPDIAVLDISMPGLNGLEVIQEARRHSFEGEFVVLTMYKEEEYYREALDLGAKGYVLKESASADLLECLLNIARGRYFVSPAVSDFVLRRSTQRDAFTQDIPSLRSLTPMEIKILKKIADGKSSKEICDALNISVRTVQNHRAHICTKLRLEGHNKLLQFALQHKSLL